MKIEYHTRNKDGKYKKDTNIDNIIFLEDGRWCYMVIEKSDGSTKRYLLKEI